LVPAHTELPEVDIETEGVTFWKTVIVTAFEVAGLSATHCSEEVMMQVITSPETSPESVYV